MGNYSSRDDSRSNDDHSIPSRPVRATATASDQQRSLQDPNNSNNNNSSNNNNNNSNSNEPSAPPIVADGSNTEVVVPTVFKWEHGGKHVYITGTFNNWERHIPMHRSGNDFTYVHNLKKGKHAFKFVVDDEWRYAPDQPTIADVDGQINNFIDVSDFVPYVGDDNFFQKSKERKIPDDDYKQSIPDLDDYTKEPPALPPHLRHIILNKPPPTIDPQSLPSPQYVSLNHLYCTAIKDGMMVLGATQRYRDKHYTIVFYSVMPQSGSQYS